MITHERLTVSGVRLLIIILVVVAAPHSRANEAAITPSDIPVEAFAALPSFSNARISPNGEKLAFFTEKNGRRNLVIQELDGENAFQVPSPAMASFRTFRWANNNYILIQSSMTLEREIFDGKTSETRWFSLSLETQEFTWLGKPKASQKELVSQSERIVDMLPDDPDHILLELDLNLDGLAEVYLTNLKEGHRRLKRHPINGIQNWYTDNNSRMRLGNGYLKSRWVVKYMQDGGFWKDLKKTEWGEKYNIEGFSSKPNTLYVRGPSQHGTMGIYELNLETEEITDTVFVNESVDINGIFENPETGRIEGIVFTNNFTRVQYISANMATIQATIDRALPRSVNTILSHVKSKDWYTILSKNDRNPGDYYIYDRPNGELMLLGNSREKIDPALMATVKPVKIPVRDGSKIPGYIVVPQGKELKNLPTIVMPHGGPFGVRDTAEWDYEAQFYSSRGYLVLKPNFRGSGGYGPAFEQAGHNQWGGLMQDDVTDATKWLITEGYSDPNRICIAGSSYGGYAAIMGVIKEPDIYRCAISVNGVMNLPKLKSGDRKSAIGGRSWTQRMGLEGSKDAEVSPYHRAKDINVPVLLMSSVDDARVPWEMSQDMHKRLRKLNKDSTFVKITDGTHHMVTAQSRLTALTEAAQFLNKHIGQNLEETRSGDITN
ncbi:alpha/beta hydrolase family protein [Kordiimonas aquimaris]|uniref:alpha/beta hydrolase family protein n=1 Tax=Kordiimonas aquimaris TaxID=707591 RepID=UPI0021D0D584|nr:prolyl oligopeptidase family serine peptidase [Kordiimonas aquimaris]